MRSAATPSVGRFDETFAFLREGYRFVSNRCDALQRDMFETRILFRPVACMRGAEAAELIYDGDRFTRNGGAMPPTVLRLLQDKGSVQLLDDEAHRHRKALFTGLLMTDDAEGRIVELFREEWDLALDRWAGAERVELLEETYSVLTRTVCRWTGVPDPDDRLAKQLSAMIEQSGSIGPGVVAALARRRRAERRVEDVVAALREGRLDVPDSAPLAVVAAHRDLEGKPLEVVVAAVELLNILRPVAAVARYVMFAAMALHEHPEWRRRLAGSSDDGYRAFAEEVRRRYPFFPVIGGVARKDVRWNGRDFSAGDWVLLDIHGTTHDPRLFPDPDAFQPGRDLDWHRFGCDFIPQGAGDPHVGHRCPGERLTVAILAEATRLLVEDMSFVVPPQDLSMPPGRIPARPKQGLLLQRVRRSGADAESDGAISSRRP